ncbi:MAG: hypothetical protein WBD36_12000 [Bacteroidota bacterium]
MLAVGCLCISCDESLPGRIDPSVNLRASTNWLAQLDYTNPNLSASFSVRNVYDDVLDGPASFQGSIEIVLLRDPTIQRHDVLTAANIVYARGYDPLLKRLTLDPGDSVRLQYSWDMNDDAGKSLLSTTFRSSIDPTCTFRSIAEPEIFGVTGQITIFDHLGAAVFQTRMFKLCFVTYRDAGPFPPACVPLQFAAKCY